MDFAIQITCLFVHKQKKNLDSEDGGGILGIFPRTMNLGNYAVAETYPSPFRLRAYLITCFLQL